MPNAKQQHYVPQVYLKAWETEVFSNSEPEKPFSGIYAFFDGERVGNGVSRKTVLWKPNLYTVSFSQLFICNECPLVYTDFVEKVFDVLRNRNPSPVYGKYRHSIIKTKSSIRKHLHTVEDWDFYYDDGRLARKTAILNDIHNLNSYIIECGLDSKFETAWESTLSSFIKEMSSEENAQIGRSERRINQATAKGILAFFFMLYCRSPQFDGLGMYTWLNHDILKPVFEEDSNDFMAGIWHTELYRMLFKKTGGHFHSLLDAAMDNCQMILYEVNDNAGSFVTSDNPAFRNRSFAVELENMNGFVFPLSPRYLVFIAKGTEGYNVVDYRRADRNTVRFFNQMVKRNRIRTIVSNQKNLDF